jgi:hypothetical protein
MKFTPSVISQWRRMKVKMNNYVMVLEERHSLRRVHELTLHGTSACHTAGHQTRELIKKTNVPDNA